MQAYRVATTVDKGKRILIEQVPFEEGRPVEVIVLERELMFPEGKDLYPLRGTTYRYDSPTEPVAVDDWEASPSTRIPMGSTAGPSPPLVSRASTLWRPTIPGDS
ncbi:MAG: hypothetical protein AB1634_10610 [Thermodesulfobacteriota bacterium]